jgi:hypothetical protein
MRDIPKSEWGPGPWQAEPDRVEWKHAGLPCLIVRGPAGALCGYVAVPPGHKAHGVTYQRLEVEVHGGLTYDGPCQEGGKICHKPAPGEPDDVFWFGFDCSHCWDISPLRDARDRLRGWAPLRFDGREQYRDLEYVRAQTERLAEQLASPELTIATRAEDDR